MVDVRCHSVLTHNDDLAGGLRLCQVGLHHGEVVVIHLTGLHRTVKEGHRVRRDHSLVQAGVQTVLLVRTVDIVAHQGIEIVLSPLQLDAGIRGRALHNECLCCGGVDNEAKSTPIQLQLQIVGCGAAIATSSMITEIAVGKTIEEALQISRNDVAEELDGLPPIKMHCSNLTADGLQAAIENYKENNQ